MAARHAIVTGGTGMSEAESNVFGPLAQDFMRIVPEGLDEMIAPFRVNGGMCRVAPWGEVLEFEDVFIRIDRCRRHFGANGPGADNVKRFLP